MKETCLEQVGGLQVVAGGEGVEPGGDGGGRAALCRPNHQGPGAQQLKVGAHDCHERCREGDEAQVEALVHRLVQLHPLCAPLHGTPSNTVTLVLLNVASKPQEASLKFL